MDEPKKSTYFSTTSLCYKVGITAIPLVSDTESTQCTVEIPFTNPISSTLLSQEMSAFSE